MTPVVPIFDDELEIPDPSPRVARRPRPPRRWAPRRNVLHRRRTPTSRRRTKKRKRSRTLVMLGKIKRRRTYAATWGHRYDCSRNVSGTARCTTRKTSTSSTSMSTRRRRSAANATASAGCRRNGTGSCGARTAKLYLTSRSQRGREYPPPGNPPRGHPQGLRQHPERFVTPVIADLS